jgi:hypothetical protein
MDSTWQGEQGGIGVRDAATAWINQRNAVCGGFKQAAVTVLRGAQTFLCCLAFGNLSFERAPSAGTGSPPASAPPGRQEDYYLQHQQALIVIEA